jgi:hypothetical protein
MATLWITLGLVTVLVALYFVLMSVRILLLKNGEFKGTCASQSPFLQKEGSTCGYCGKPVGNCENDDTDNESEVNKVISKFN